MDELKLIGEKIRELRKKHGYTQEALELKMPGAYEYINPNFESNLISI